MAIQFHDKVADLLFHPAPYKVLWGGRGSTKSWSCARGLLILARRRKLRWLCCRETQRSIRDSVHRLLADQISAMGLTGYDVKAHSITNATTGSEFIFAGLRHNIAEIKSMEGLDGCWVEEAHLVSKTSWTTLIPTIRKPAPGGPFGRGSEIWITFNPELDTDYTYQFWVVDPPTGTKVLQINWRDNPWFPAVLNDQRRDMLKKDPLAYDVVWEGRTRSVVEGAIYAREIERAMTEKRILRFPHVVGKKVNVYFDLGRSDLTSMWFVQQVGLNYYFIDYYQNSGFGIDHYLEKIDERKYRIGELWFPHDAAQGHQSAPKTILRQVRESGYNDRAKLVKNIGVANGINAMRAVFPRCHFDAERCQEGLQALRHYQYAVDPDTHERSLSPRHDWSSHAADAIRMFSVAIRDGEADEIDGYATPQTETQMDRHEHAQGWMR